MDFDVHGWTLKVEGDHAVNAEFRREFGPFRCSRPVRRPDVLVRRATSATQSRISAKGETRGLDLASLGEGEDEDAILLTYDSTLSRTGRSLVVNFTRFLMNWPDKCLAHGAALHRSNRALVVFAAPNVGKTTLVLGMLAQGFQYVADDWLVIDSNGNVYSAPVSLRLYYYNLLQSRTLCARLVGRATAHQRLAARSKWVLYNLARRISWHRYVQFGVEKLLAHPEFEVQLSDLVESVGEGIPATCAIWLSRDDVDTIKYCEEDCSELARRVAASFMFEYGEYFRWYYKVAQHGCRPQRGIERRHQHTINIIERGLERVPCYRVVLPRHIRDTEMADWFVGFWRDMERDT